MGFSMRASSDEQLGEEDFDMLDDHLSISVEVPRGGEASQPQPPPAPAPDPPHATSKSRAACRRPCREDEGGQPRTASNALDQRLSVHHKHRPTTDSKPSDDSDNNHRTCPGQPPGVCQARNSKDHQELHHSDVHSTADDADAPTGPSIRRRGSKATSEASRPGIRRAAPREPPLTSRLKVGQPLSENGKRIRRQVGSRLPRAKKTLSDSSVSDKMFSRTTVRDKGGVTPAGLLKQGEGGQTTTADSDLTLNGASLECSGISVVEISMSEYQMAVLGNVEPQASRQSDKGPTVCDQQLQKRGAGTKWPTSGSQRLFNSDVSDCTNSDDEGDDSRTNAGVAELVSGLDSQISALCRNLALLLLPERRPTGEVASHTLPPPPCNTRNPSDGRVLGAIEMSDSLGTADTFSTSEDRRYYDCVPSDQDAADVLSDSRMLDSVATKNALQAAQSHDKVDASSQDKNDSAEKCSLAKKNFSAASSHALCTFQHEEQRFTDKTTVHRWAWRQPGHTIAQTARPHSHSELIDSNREDNPTTVKVSQVHSVLALQPQSRGDELLNVVEISAEISDLQVTETSVNTAPGDTLRGQWGMEADQRNKLAGTWNTWFLQDLSQVLEQSDVLRAMWQNHKMQLGDVLASRDREAARAGRLEQGLARARHVIQSLRRQRRQVHQYLEQKEEEWATALRSHRNEATFLRRKVLVGLEDKKHVIVDPKKDGRLAAVLDSLLGLHMEREHFLALDMAKQNKINELKLLAIRQELSLQELKERNTELHHVLNVLLQCLPNPGTATRATDCSSSPRLGSHFATHGVEGGGCSWPGSELTDLLYCDRTTYLPRHSTCPDLVSLKVYNLGGEQSHLGLAMEDTFDASSQHCNPDGDFHSIYRHRIAYSDRTLAEDLLRELSLYGPGSPEFTLSDVQ